MKIKFNKLIAMSVMLFFVIINTSIAWAASKMTITVSNVYAEAGEDVEVPVVLTGNDTGVLAMQLSLSYDSRLTFKSIQQGTALSTLDLTPIKDFSANPCTILLEGLDADTSNGTIIILTFTAPADVTGNFNVSLRYNVGEIYDNDMNDIDVNIVNGSVKIASTGVTEPEITKPTLSVSDYIKTSNSIAFDVYASSPTELTGTIITALYKANGALDTVKIYPAASIVNAKLDSVEGAYIKVMWWDMDTLTPFTNMKKIDL